MGVHITRFDPIKFIDAAPADQWAMLKRALGIDTSEVDPNVDPTHDAHLPSMKADDQKDGDA